MRRVLLAGSLIFGALSAVLRKGDIAIADSRAHMSAIDGLRLAPGERTGTSNEATDGVFKIEPEPRSKAVWLLILDRKYLFGVAAAANASRA